MSEENRRAEMAEYRKWLITAEQKSQEDFDKTILTLSGGALGISFAFLKDIVGPNPITSSWLLLGAWFAWAFSTFSVLMSYYLSHLALRFTIRQVDDGTISSQPPGGVFAQITSVLNASGAVLFLVGVCCITIFAVANLSAIGATYDRKEAAVTTPVTSSTAARTQNAAVAANPNSGQSSSTNRIHSPTASAEATKK